MFPVFWKPEVIRLRRFPKKMKQKASKFLSLLLAAVLLLSLMAPAALAAENTNTVYLRTAEDLAEFSQNCTLDSWSQGKTVYLEADIDLTGVDFTPIPTFGGTIEGQGHTISGLSITGSGNVRGLFRYIQSTGAVRDLHVTGAISPTDRKNTLGGLVGENQGTITNCSFSGTVSGADSIGGLVGINEAQGQLINCTFSGSVTGEHLHHPVRKQRQHQHHGGGCGAEPGQFESRTA